MCCLIATFFILLPSQDYPVAKDAIAQQKKKIIEAQKYLEKCEKSQINPSLAKRSAMGELDKDTYFIFPSADYKKKQIDVAKVKLENAKDHLDELEAGFIPPEEGKENKIKNPLKIGDSGILPEYKFKVFQVLGKDKALADLVFYYDVQTVYNGMVPVTETKLFNILVMLKNIDTTGFTDGSIQDTTETFQVTATDTYKTLAGSKTVFVLEPKKQKTEDKTKEQIQKEKAEYSKRLAQIRDKRKQTEEELDRKAKTELSAKTTNENNKKARESVSKMVSGLGSSIKRYDDSFKESNPKIADQMQAQAITYIQNGDKRLADAIKDVNASTLPDAEKQNLIKQANEALAQAKKKVGVK